ncbi:hypothetical protein Nans01_44220 [Nocardiopsis ansamitocini]|uniref:Uncharacterized protein n=1 Tax=Nocardiopsis ansamitocini TaxID=1670832 RepID=A0A9W6UIM1_9ACTN|nr:hypothetical protein Nans01_44220 [Nocardiopsis ansamitocini]
MALLGGDDLLQLAGVEEDPTTALALVDVDSHAVKGTHVVLALGTNHGAIVGSRLSPLVKDREVLPAVPLRLPKSQFTA